MFYIRLINRMSMAGSSVLPPVKTYIHEYKEWGDEIHLFFLSFLWGGNGRELIQAQNELSTITTPEKRQEE